MKKKPSVAILGRPNTGKSTFINRLVGSRESITDDMPGVTRDRLYFDVEWSGKTFTVIDTGGIIPGDEDEIMVSIAAQAELAVEQADVIVFLVDGKDGVTPADEDIANLLRRHPKKKVFLAVNKIDTPEKLGLVNEFYSLGIGEPLPVTAMHGTGYFGDLLDKIIEALPETPEEEDEDKIKVAVVGKPNVGKSSLINSLLGEERVIVSDVAGTTRDAIDTEVIVDGEKYTFVDTAGIRKKSKVEYGVEKFSVARSIKAIRTADVVLLMLDALEGLTDQEKKICNLIVEHGRAFVIAVNKWDAVEGKHTYSVNEFEKKIRDEAPFLNYVNFLFISAKTKQRLNKIFPAINEAYDFTNKRIATSLLNRIVAEAVAINPPPSQKGKKLKIYYSSQTNVAPPTFVLFVNDKKLMPQSYERYLENKLREAFGFTGTPIRIVVREKGEEK